jgi:hypothetical protein
VSETTFVVLAAVLGPAWLAVIVVRTVLAEKAAEKAANRAEWAGRAADRAERPVGLAEHGPGRAEPGMPLRRSVGIRRLDVAGIVVGGVLFVALIGRMIAALG